MLNEEKSASGGENQNTNPEEAQYPDPTKPVFKPQRRFPIPSKSWIIFIAANIIIPLTFAAVYLNLSQNSESKEAVQTPTPSPTQTPAPTAADADPTADWKSHQGDGFRFKYPDELIIEELKNEYNLVTANRTNAILLSSGLDNSDNYTFKIFVEANKNNLSPEDFLSNYKNRLKTPSIPNDPSGEIVLDKINNSQIDYQNGDIRGIHALFGFDYDYDIIIATHEGKVYVFEYTGDQGGKISESEEKIVNQILSTFKFTE